MEHIRHQIEVSNNSIKEKHKSIKVKQNTKSEKQACVQA